MNQGSIPKVEVLREFVGRCAGTLLIVTHDNPDPDALASAFALHYLVTSVWNGHATIAYGGMIGRAENRTLVKSIKMDLHPLSELRLKDYKLIALMDSQPVAGNHSLPESLCPDIVIDHHESPYSGKENICDSPFADIRPDYGSTSSILTEYLRDSGLTDIHREVATALIYGIRSDTRDFGRTAGPPDSAANIFLYPWVDFKLLSSIEHPRLSREYFKRLARTIEQAVVSDDIVIADLKEIDSTDALSEIADLLVRLEGIKWALCYGRLQDGLYFSLRMAGRQGHAGNLAKQIVTGIGTGGGHHLMAGGKIPWGREGAAAYPEKAQELKNLFLDAVKRKTFRGKPLA